MVVNNDKHDSYMHANNMVVNHDKHDSDIYATNMPMTNHDKYANGMDANKMYCYQ